MRTLTFLIIVLAAGVVAAQEKPKAAAKPEENTPAAEKPAGEERADEKPAEAASSAAEEKSADEAAAPAEKSELEKMLHSGALGYMIDGGVFMWPIFFLGILAVGVIIERFRSLRMLGTDTDELRAKVVELLRSDNVEEALKLCDSQQGPVPAVLACGLRKYLVLQRLNYDPGKIEEQVIKSMDDYSVHIVAALERHLPVLATVSSAAPMIGFLGTVQGMVVSFSEIQANIGTANIVELAAGGIKVALLTTCLGLIVGIPTYVFYNYFTGVINRYVLDVEESASELIEGVTLQMALENK